MAVKKTNRRKKKTPERRTGREKVGRRRITKAEKMRMEAERERQRLLLSEATVIFAFAAAILMLLGNFGFCGAAGAFLKRLQLGLFGIPGYLFPLFLLILVLYGVANRGNGRAAFKITAASVCLPALSGMMHLFFGQSVEGGNTLSELYQSGSGGGLVGGAIFEFLKGLFGNAGGFLILFVLFLFMTVVITERSFVGAVKKRGGKVCKKAQEDLENFREERRAKAESKREYEERLREKEIDFEAGAPPTVVRTEFSPSFESALAAVSESENEKSFSRIAEDEICSEQKQEDALFLSEIETPEISEMPEAPEMPDLSEIMKPDTFSDVDPYLEEAFQRANTILNRDSVREEAEMQPVFREHLDVQKEEKKFEEPEHAERKIVTASGKVMHGEYESLETHIRVVKTEAEPGKTLREGTTEEKTRIYRFPPLELLEQGKKVRFGGAENEYREIAGKLQDTLHSFGVDVTVTNFSRGPAVTRYELTPAQGVKVGRIVALSDDIKLSLAASDIRIEAPIPGKSAVGIEIPNKENNTVYLRDLFESEEFKESKGKLSFAVGKDIGGQTVVTDIAKMPHLLIAGATGSGKSVCINTLIMSILYRYRPDDVKLIMIDPKVVELSVYNGIPHLLIPVVTDPKKAAGALNWAVSEMTDRYRKFAEASVRDLKGYNEKVMEVRKSGEIEENDLPEALPQIVIIIDELADLMMVSKNEVEEAICRIAQLARAAGMHLVIATQRPSVNVITGLIKANIPSRIAFAVSSGIDSRTILDSVGAEKLLGKGDMLFSPQAEPHPLRVQGAFVSDREVQKVVDFIKEEEIPLSYDRETVAHIVRGGEGAGASTSERDDLFAQAGRFIIEKDKASIGNLQRMFKIGFNRAARIMDQLSEAGVVGEEQGTKPRDIMMTAEQFEELIRQSG